jgi:hypothetical protein
MTVKQQVEAFNEMKAKQAQKLSEAAFKIEKDFENYIVNKNIPLAQRWKEFENSPEDLNNHIDVYPSLHYKEVGPGLDFFMDELMPNNMNYGDKTMDLKNIFSLYFRENGEVAIDMVKLHLENEIYTDEELKELIIAGVEEILALNLGSFQCDS